jgi:hypothetical protein
LPQALVNLANIFANFVKKFKNGVNGIIRGRSDMEYIYCKGNGYVYGSKVKQMPFVLL